MKKVVFIILLLNLSAKLFAQIDINKIRKPNPNDNFESILIEENKKLDVAIIKTDIWISDEYDNQYDFDYGIIINKNKIANKLTKYKDVDLGFLIRLILGHEKQHARYYQDMGKMYFKKYKYSYDEVSQSIKEYPSRVHVVQLKKDEIKADLVAGFYAHELNNLEDVTDIIEILRHFKKKGKNKGMESFPNNVKQNEKLKNTEIITLNFFAGIGDEQNGFTKYPNSYERITALEMGMKASLVYKIYQYLKNHKSNLTSDEIEILKNIVEKTENDLGYFHLGYHDQINYFHEYMSDFISAKITHENTELGKSIIFTLLDLKKTNENGYLKFSYKIRNEDTQDSLKVFYSVLLTEKPNDESLLYDSRIPKFLTISAVHSIALLAPKETKFLTDSIIDPTLIIYNLSNYKLILPGQFGSLYFTRLIDNNKKSKKDYSNRKNLPKIEAKDYEPNLDDLVLNFSEIQSDFSLSDVEEYMDGIGFQQIEKSYISYDIFIRKRPYMLIVYPNRQKSRLETIVYSSLNINNVKKYMDVIFKKLGEQSKIFFQQKIDENKNMQIVLKKNNEKEIGYFDLIYDKINTEYQVILSIVK